MRRSRSTIYRRGYWSLCDRLPSLAWSSVPERPGNTERPGRRGAGQASFQIPLRAMIPQKIDNMLVTGKSIATSHGSSRLSCIHLNGQLGQQLGLQLLLPWKAIAPYQRINCRNRTWQS